MERPSCKMLVASMSNVAASGGYYVACAADKIFTNPGTLTGSIGVIMSLLNVEDVTEKIGIRSVVIKSGKFKDVPSAMRDMTDEERAYLQGVIDDTHSQFIEAVLGRRRTQLEAAQEKLGEMALTSSTELQRLGPDAAGLAEAAGQTVEEYLRYIADGRVMTGRQAAMLGLVDELGARSGAIAELARMANIDAPELYEYRPKRTLIDFLNAEARSAIQGVGLPPAGLRLEYRMPY